MKYVINLILIASLLISCKKENDGTVPVESDQTGQLKISVNHFVDQSTLTRDSVFYLNDAGNIYSVRRLQYYLSALELLREDSTTVSLSEYLYVDAFKDEFSSFTLKHKLSGHFIGMRFNIGLDSIHNKAFCLPSVKENLDMAWPATMGGGYHFLKLEGEFVDDSLNLGYAMHLGNNACLITPITCWKEFNLAEDDQCQLTLVMNVNEWFTNPYTYDLVNDPCYIMGNATAMDKIKENGRDVFNLQ